jgi:hypothetical protein
MLDPKLQDPVSYTAVCIEKYKIINSIFCRCVYRLELSPYVYIKYYLLNLSQLFVEVFVYAIYLGSILTLNDN